MRFVDFYFDFSSTNSYFAAFLLPEICARNDARVNWMPAHFAALFRGTGFDTMAMTPRKARYLWRDHARYAEWTGLPFRKPSRFPIKTSSALRAVLAIAAETHADDGGVTREHAQRTLSQAFMRAYWERDEDISDRSVLATSRDQCRLRRRQTDGCGRGKVPAREDLAFLTEGAVARGVFGAPTFFVGDEMFWGKDRLDFVERLLKPPD